MFVVFNCIDFRVWTWTLLVINFYTLLLFWSMHVPSCIFNINITVAWLQYALTSRSDIIMTNAGTMAHPLFSIKSRSSIFCALKVYHFIIILIDTIIEHSTNYVLNKCRLFGQKYWTLSILLWWLRCNARTQIRNEVISAKWPILTLKLSRYNSKVLSKTMHENQIFISLQSYLI